MVDRRQADRRRSDLQLFGERDPRTERRRRNRRRLIQAGLIALAGAAGAKAHLLTRTHLLSDPAEVSVEVSEDGFRVPGDQDQEYDRAELEALAEEAAQQYGIRPELVRAVIETESNYRTEAVSHVGALGPMQLMPATAKSLGIEDPGDARQNIFGGTQYLSKLLDRFNGNVALALASYNAGPTVVSRHKGIPPYGETRGYVSKIHKLLADTDAAFTLPAPPRPRARGRTVLKSRTLMARAGLKDRRARVTRASVTRRKPARSSSKSRAIAVKYKASSRRARPSASRA